MASLLLFLDLSEMDSAILDNAKRIIDNIEFDKIGLCHYVEIQDYTDNSAEAFFNRPDKSIEELIGEELLDMARQYDLPLDKCELIIHNKGGKEDLVDKLNKSDYSLVVLGKKTIHAGTGSFSIRLSGMINKPILFVTESTRLSLKHILIPTEFSKYSKKAASILDQIGSFSVEQVTVLHILRFTPSYFPFFSETSERMINNLEKKALKKLDNFCAINLPNYPVKKEVLYGADTPISRLIFEYVKTNHIDLVIMGKKGYGDNDDEMIGSVASKMIQSDMDIPVLLVS